MNATTTKNGFEWLPIRNRRSIAIDLPHNGMAVTWVSRRNADSVQHVKAPPCVLWLEHADSDDKGRGTSWSLYIFKKN